MAVPTEHPMTWKQVMTLAPVLGIPDSFFSWVVQKFGPLPDGPIQQTDYERWKAAWEEEAR